MKREAAADRDAEAAIKASGGQAFLPLDAYVGVYHDPCAAT